MGTKRRRGQDEESTAVPVGKKHQYTQHDATLAELYSRLADDVKETRTQAAKEILKIVDAAEDQEKVDKICQRLVRGLCSSRKAARLGYAPVLIEIYTKRCPEAQAAEEWVRATINAIETYTTSPSNGSHQERRDHQLGRCWAFRSLVSSEVFTKIQGGKGPICFSILLEHIFALYKEAPALRQECGSIANSILLSPAKTSTDALVSTLLQSYAAHALIKTSEGLSAWLLARLSPSQVSFPANIWHDNDPLHPKERSVLLQILRDNSTDTSAAGGTADRSASGIAQKKPSTAWPIVFKCLWIRATEDGHAKFFAKFWTEVVNDGFFSEKASIERKAIGLQIVQMAIESAPPVALPHVISPNVLRCLINQRSDKGKTNLFHAAQAPLTALVKRASKDRQIILPVFHALVTTSGLTNFDRVTHTKTLEDIASPASSADMESIVKIISDIIQDPKVSPHLDADTSRRNSADLLLAIARKHSALNSQTNAEDEAQQSFPWMALLEVLSRAAYLVHKNDKDTTIPKKIRETFQARLTSVLTSTMDTKADSELDHVWKVVDYLDRGITSGEYRLVLGPSGSILRVLNSAVSRIRDIKAQEAKASVDRKASLQAFALLFSLSVLQVYNGEPDADAILQDVEQCYSDWAKSKNSSSSLIEILLSFVSKRSALFRKMAEQVFSAISGQISHEGIEALLDILEKPENINGQRELFDNSGDGEAAPAHGGDSADDNSSDDSDASDVEVVEMEDEDDTSESDDSDASDVEVVDMVEEDEDSESSETEGDDDDDSSGSGSDSEDPSHDGADEEEEAFKAKLALALGTKLTNGKDDESDHSDDSDMDDDQMMAVDHHLTTIFKERSKQPDKKKELKDARATMVDFKSRVLDFLAIYVKQCYSAPLAIGLLLPLVQLVRTTNAPKISERAFVILKQLFDTCTKHKTYPECEADELLGKLAGVMEELRQNTSKVHANAASRTALFLAKMLTVQDREHYAVINYKYADLQNEFYANPGSKIPASCFTEWMSWSLNSRKA